MNAKVLLRGSGWHAGADRGWRFPIRSVIQADRVEDVPAVLEEVERATRAGLTAVGFVSYEAAAAFGLPAREPCPYPLPFAWFGFCRKEDIQKRTEEEFDPDYHPGEISTPEITIPATPDCFADTLDQLKACLAAGETYQVNYTLRAGVRGSLTGPALFHRLYRAQPVPYAAYLATDEWEILSLSPELFLQRSGGLLLSRPMKGTWRRGRTLDEDALHAERLRTSDKERAENLMIVDMVRNDLGRLCRPGSITTGPLFEIETYRSVLQMTGTVQGIVKENVSLHEIFAAVFPAASITGAPKHRTMEIIRRVEPEPRGVYCGAIGWIHPGGDFTFNVAIRTLYGRPGNYTLGVGGGIVWDSDARREYEEIQTKIAFLQDGAFAFSLLETLRLEADDTFTYLAEHLGRLERSARYWQFRCDRGKAVRELLEYRQRVPYRPAVVRLTMDETGEISLSHRPVTPLPGRARVLISATAVDSQNRFLFHKTTNRALYDRARAAGWRNGYFDTLFTNEFGHVTEGCVTNLFYRRGNRWHTPPLADGLLEGVWRRRFIQETTAGERPVSVPELLAADEVVIGNSVIGRVRVDAIEVEASAGLGLHIQAHQADQPAGQ